MIEGDRQDQQQRMKLDPIEQSLVSELKGDESQALRTQIIDSKLKRAEKVAALLHSD